VFSFPTLPKVYYGRFCLPSQSAVRPVGWWLPWEPIPSLSRNCATNKLPQPCASATRARKTWSIPRNCPHILIDFMRQLFVSLFRGVITEHCYRWTSEWRGSVTFLSPECFLVLLLEPEFRVSLKVCTNHLFTVHVFFSTCLLSEVGWDSPVGIATGYGLDGPGIESRWGMRFSAPIQTGPGAHPASYTMGTGSSRG
jgi:hypothetical protein